MKHMTQFAEGCFTVILVLSVTHPSALGTSDMRVKREDDMTITTLTKMVQTQATTISQLTARLQVLENMQTDLAQLKNRMAVVTKPVAFSARFSGIDIRNIGTHGIFKFDITVTNIGGGYDNVTGIFTAPISGTYIFYLAIMSSNDHSDHIKAAISKQDNVLDLVWAAGEDDADDQGSTLVTTHVAAGEHVWVYHYDGSPTVQGSWYTVFSGYLVQAD